ncbi:MAG TPA: YciI family protein [Acetobacteraceae bacterium]|nr:YciI family protein [Acetobacteraceae bacterium]
MLFAVIRHDKPGCVGLRQSARPRHLEYLKDVMSLIRSGGAILNDDGHQVGSILLIDVADRAAAEEFAAPDPFVEAGLFASTQIVPFRMVFADGVRID